MSLSRLKSGKAPGMDTIPNEVWKCSTGLGVETLCAVFNEILELGRVPEERGEIVLRMIPKTGNVNDINKQRPIALINTITFCINYRVSSWAENGRIIPEARSGFRSGRSCKDNTFVLSAIIGLRFQKAKGKLFCAFADYKDAFGSLPHGMLWHILSRLGVGGRMLEVLMSLYRVARVFIRTSEGSPKFFPIYRGILQGDSFSPLAFSSFLPGLESYIRDQGLSGINVNGLNEILILMFADDICLFGDTKLDVERKLQSLFQFSESMALAVNPSKTKVYGW